MWIIEFLPEWAIHGIFGLGVVGIILGFTLGFIPFVKTYKLAVQVISLLVFTLGVYLEGGLADYREWQFKAAELEKRVKEAEVKAAQKNVEIQEKVVERDKVIVQRGRDIVQYVDREVVKREEVIKYIENCPVPKDIVDAHNAAALLNKAVEGGKK
jgi:hypothetical protein